MLTLIQKEMIDKLNEENELFELLKDNPPAWWKVLVDDEDIYIDIRKDNYIDIYYNGGGVVKDLKFKRKRLQGNTHYKYLLREESEYISYSFNVNNEMSVKDESVDLLHFEDFDENILKRIKANISSHYPATSEKGIQARFIRNAGRFIDSEFAYNLDDKGLRIDLVWIDKKNTRIQFVELKTTGDSRLFTDGITEQLKKYTEFVSKHEDDLLNYYRKIFRIKKKLNILPVDLQKLESLDDYEIEKRPLLLLGDCSKEWIDNNAEDINQKIRKTAIGAYYFGSPSHNCDIISKPKKRNRFTFQ